jgi:hypothetical protein
LMLNEAERRSKGKAGRRKQPACACACDMCL